MKRYTETIIFDSIIHLQERTHIVAELLLGIDLGTSSVRAGIYQPDGTCLGIGTRHYPILTPSPGRAEQDPESWWNLTSEAIREVLDTAHRSGADIAGISFSGQMHGTVLLDYDGIPVHPAIIWADSRSTDDLTELADLIGYQRTENILMNRFFTGTQAATVYWLMRHDLATWKQVRHILSPKDYIRFRMCGLYSTEPSDVSATLLGDVKKREWSDEILSTLEIPVEFLPYLVNSDQHIAETVGIEEKTGIPDGVPVVLGGADQPCAAMGNGILDPGAVMVTIGTGAQIFAPIEKPEPSPGMNLNMFCHLPNARWYYHGATFVGGFSLAWLRDTFYEGASFETISTDAASAPVGSHGIVFLPEMNGRRMQDPTNKSSEAFRGLRFRNTRAHCARSIMERVVYELMDLLALTQNAGAQTERIIASGGFTASPVWMQILADCFRIPIMVSPVRESACFGAALTAGIGIGTYDSFEDACENVPPVVETIDPIEQNSIIYFELYKQYLSLLNTSPE